MVFTDGHRDRRLSDTGHRADPIAWLKSPPLRRGLLFCAVMRLRHEYPAGRAALAPEDPADERLVAGHRCQIDPDRPSACVAVHAQPVPVLEELAKGLQNDRLVAAGATHQPPRGRPRSCAG